MSRLRVLQAFLMRDFRIARTYRFAFLFDVLGILAGLALYFFIDEFLGRNGQFFAFALAGLVVLRLHTALMKTVLNSEAAIAEGTLEATVAFPVPLWLQFMGAAAFEMVRALVYAGIMLGLALLIFDGATHTGPEALLAALAALAGGALMFLALTALIVGAVLVMRQGVALSGLLGLAVPIISGAYFPLSALPDGLEHVCRAAPLRLPVDVARAGLLDGRFPAGKTAALLAVAAGMLAIGLACFALGAQHARRVAGLSRP